MKRLILLTMILAICGALYAQDELFKKYENTKGVETVYISKNLLSIVGTTDIGDLNVSKAAKKIERIQVLECEQVSLLQGIRDYALSIFKREKYEQIMRTTDDGEVTYIYQKQRGKLTEFVILTSEKKELTIVNILGTLTLKEIKEIAN